MWFGQPDAVQTKNKTNGAKRDKRKQKVNNIAICVHVRRKLLREKSVEREKKRREKHEMSILDGLDAREQCATTGEGGGGK